MRFIPYILLVLIILTGCAGQKAFTSKGVSYPGQPARELEMCHKFVNPPTGDPEFPAMTIIGTPLSYKSSVYLPLETIYTKAKDGTAYTTVYKMDPVTGVASDSLVIKSDSTKMAFRHVIAYDNLYLVGLKDSLCQVYKVDADLKLEKEYNTGIVATYLPYVAAYDNRLRIVAVDKSKRAMMYELRFDTLQRERERLLAKDTGHYYMDKGNLWFFSATDSLFSTSVTNLSKYDPTPVYKDFAFQIPKQSGMRSFDVKAADSLLYVRYTWFTDDAKGGSKISCINYLDGKIQSKDYTGLVTFNITKTNGKTYIFRTDLQQKRNNFIVSELGYDLKESNPKVSFFLADLEIAGSIVPFTGTKYFLTGTFEQKTGKKYVSEIPGMPKVKMEEMIPQPFLAIFNLE